MLGNEKDKKDILVRGSGEFAVFCGAGISRNSGLPLANELRQYILEKLLIEREDMGEIINSALPFEAFMETLEDTGISKILEIFEQGVPNTNHIVIAKLAKNGYLETICTTNFDLLIENALISEGLEKGRDFEVYCDEEQFLGIDLKDNDKKMIRIFKIHGSVDDKDSIRTTLEIVASRIFSDKRMSLIRYLFSTGKHKKVLILGYSCSDEFDITPQIQSIKENRKEIILVDHCKKGREIEDVGKQEDKNPFKKFPGMRIKYNTNDFIKDQWDFFKETIGEYEFVESQINWKRYIDDWARRLQEGDKCSITGSIFGRISNFKKAFKYFEKGLEIYKEIGDTRGEARGYFSLGTLYSYAGDFGKAVESYERALEIFMETGDKSGVADCYTNLGVANRNIGNFKKAIELHEKALEIYGTFGEMKEEARTFGEMSGQASAYDFLGIVYTNLGNF